jgi:hypothetical protein
MPGAVALPSLAFAGYQDGSIVSRTLLKRSGGTITFFAFDRTGTERAHYAV